MEHLRFMQSAYQEAIRAFDEGEVPVGAVIVKNGSIIGKGYNRIEKLSDATAHAEIIAISAASSRNNSWRLDDCTLYVTLEPCLMCLGAIMQSRVNSVVYAATDKKLGAIDSHYYQQQIEHSFGYFPEIISGIMAPECSHLLSTFFRKIRNI
ncbi:MAG TPA: nucleoside deaminase [Chitinispirillaceae bacterium]|nr:nucleoside deaminase [Chitinispirillaceae bacterium]